MKNISRACLAVGAAFALAATVGCSVDTSGTADEVAASDVSAASGDRSWNEGGAVTIPAPEPGSGEGLRIMYTGFGQDNNHSNAIWEGVKAEGELLGAEVEYTGPPSYDPVAQSKLLCDAASSGRYDAIVIQPIDSASIVECAKQALDAGIKIASIQFPIGPNIEADSIQVDGVTTQIREDVPAIAQAHADEIVNQCEALDPCKVVLLWGVRSLSFDAAKVPVIMNELDKHSNIEVACQADAGYSEDSGRTASADCISAVPDVDVIFAGSDESAHGTEQSLEDAGLSFGSDEGDVKIISSYVRKHGVQQIIDGKRVMSTFLRPDADGRAAVDLLLLEMAGENVPSNVNSQDLDEIGVYITPEIVSRFPSVMDKAY